MEKNPFEKIEMYERIFESSIPNQWALINIAGMSKDDANDLIIQRQKYLLNRAKLTYRLARLENHGK